MIERNEDVWTWDEDAGVYTCTRCGVPVLEHLTPVHEEFHAQVDALAAAITTHTQARLAAFEALRSEVEQWAELQASARVGRYVEQARFQGEEIVGKLAALFDIAPPA